jgi:hypothetical protein
MGLMQSEHAIHPRPYDLDLIAACRGRSITATGWAERRRASAAMGWAFCRLFGVFSKHSPPGIPAYDLPDSSANLLPTAPWIIPGHGANEASLNWSNRSAHHVHEDGGFNP